MKRAIAHVMAERMMLGVAGLVLIGVAAAFFWFRNSNGTEQLLTVEPRPFLQEVSVSGRVIAERDVDLGFATGGRVERVTVRVGDRVAAGTILAEVENGDLGATLAAREASLEGEEARLRSLRAGTRPEEIAVAEADLAAAAAAERQAELALVDEIKSAYTSADDAVRTFVDQYYSNPASPTPQLSFNVSNSETEAAAELGRRDIEVLLGQWALSSAALTVAAALDPAAADAKEKLASVAAFLDAANRAVSAGLPTGSVTSATLATYASNTGTARAAVSAAIGALTTAETALVKARAARVASDSTLRLKRAGATADDIAAQEAAVKAARAARDDVAAQIRKTLIIAPFAGTITVVDAEAGAVAAANAPQITLIGNGEFIVESYVPEINIALVAPGDPARVTLDAYGDDRIFDARVTAIDPAETLRDGVPTYRMLLSFAEASPDVRAGMTANVVVVTDERPDVIAIPQRLVRSENGVKVVTVKVGDAYQERTVVVGAVSFVGDLEIVSGLAPGDLVVIK